MSIFFKDIDEIIYHTDWNISLDDYKLNHILTDRIMRFPIEYQKWDEQKLGNTLQAAIEFAETMAKRNYKIIIPKYDPNEHTIQLLMPIYLEREYKKKPDFALVLTPTSNINNSNERYYKAETILEMEDAYNDARLIAEPSEPWIAKSVVEKDENNM